MALTRDQILGLSDIEIKEIDVPAWNSTVFIRQLTRGQQDAYLKRQFGKFDINAAGKKGEAKAAFDAFGHDTWLFAQGVCDENGKRLFTDADVEKLAEKSGEAIGFVAKEIILFSGMKQDVEELDELKN